MAFIRADPLDSSKFMVYHGVSAPTCSVLAHGSAVIEPGLISVDVQLDAALMALATNVTFQLTPVGLPRLASIQHSASVLTIFGNVGIYHWSMTCDIECPPDCHLCAGSCGSSSVAASSVLIGSSGGIPRLSVPPCLPQAPEPSE